MHEEAHKERIETLKVLIELYDCGYFRAIRCGQDDGLVESATEAVLLLDAYYEQRRRDACGSRLSS